MKAYKFVLKSNTMKKSLLFFSVLSLISLLNKNTFSQGCGGGTYRLDIYTINGTEKLNVSYELFPINEYLLDSALQGPYLKILKSKIHLGMIVDSTFARQISDNNLLDELERRLLSTNNLIRGNAINSGIKFNTSEGIYFLCMLKLSSDEMTVYVIGNFIGGCGTNSAILWNKYPVLFDYTDNRSLYIPR